MTLLRTLKRRYGIAAPRVAVHTQWPWYWRWLAVLATGAVLVWLVWMTYDFGRALAGFDSGRAAAEQARLAEELRSLRDENADLRSQLAAIERQVQIEQATHGDLAGQIKTLSDENALIKEDLAFFQTLMSSHGDPARGVTINRFRVRADTLPGEYRYQLLLVQARTRGKEFQGRLQLVVDLLEEGQARTLVLPRKGEAAAPFDLSFRFYQRIEGSFIVPSDAVVKRVQARVLEDGEEQPRTSQSVNMS
jgi:hypothetical protein